MAPPGKFNEPLEVEADKCYLPFLDTSGRIVFFDVQSAEPGAFEVPGVIDLETYEPGEAVESSWIYFKGDPQAGPQPGHPFDMPFDNDLTKFSIDMVRDDDTSTVIYQVMSPANATLFWKGSAPFEKRGNHTMSVPRLDQSCKYYSIGEMNYRWWVPKDIERDTIFRLKLTTDDPPTTHLSGKLQISDPDAASLPSLELVSGSQTHGDSRNLIMSLAAAGLLVLVLASWTVLRLRRRSARIALE